MTTEIGAEAADMMCCASCGRAKIDDVKLMGCDGGCDLARYCGDECQQDHLEKHEAICKERVAELRDEILFKQPESSHLGDCPICCLPLPLDKSKFAIHSCCSKVVCTGCVVANLIRELEQRLEQRCPFCRIELNTTDGEWGKNNHKERAAANDPVALVKLGLRHYNEGDYDKAFEYYTRAAKLGDAIAHNNLALIYRRGHGVEQDDERAVHHFEEAAIAGHPDARYYLAVFEGVIGRMDRAVKHWIIGANLGHDVSLQRLKEFYKEGHVSKDELAAALRAHQAAVDATKSQRREAAEECRRSNR